jgi:SAM-dependent methyltransferase
MSSAVESPRYDQIGRGYARMRREDPRFREQIHAALGTARTVVNVGAGAGSYEPQDRIVIAIEPSDVMAGQRPPERSPAIRGDAAHLPLRDGSVDAAMAVLTVHHWDRDQQPGLQEMRRVPRDAVVIVTYDPTVSGQMRLMADYLPEVAQLDQEIFAAPDVIAGWLGGHTVVESMAISRDTPDWMLGSFCERQPGSSHSRTTTDAAMHACGPEFSRRQRLSWEPSANAAGRGLNVPRLPLLDPSGSGSCALGAVKSQ